MASPNPNWKPGTKINSPLKDPITFDPKTLPQKEMYKLLIGAVIPRPIAFVSTLNSKGEGNLAPFSFFNAVASKPPCLMIAIARKDNGEKKDTLRNIEETGEFVINSANQWLLEALVHCAAAYPYGVNEMTKVGLTPIASQKVKPPRVKESALQYECRLHQNVQIGDGTQGSTNLVIGEVVNVHIAEDAYQNGRIIASKLKPMARLGGAHYANLGEIFEIPIPEPLI